MDFHAEAVIVDEFLKFVMNGQLYRGSKPVMWSPVEKTALADAEVEYHDHLSPTIWVKFPVTQIGRRPGDAAGRPNYSGVGRDLDHDALDHPAPTAAIAYNPTIAYGLYEVKAGAGRPLGQAGRTLLVVADKLAEEVCSAGRATSELRRALRGVSPADGLSGVVVRPSASADSTGYWDFRVPMLAGDHVTDDAGTGFVHTAPATAPTTTSCSSSTASSTG